MSHASILGAFFLCSGLFVQFVMQSVKNMTNGWQTKGGTPKSLPEPHGRWDGGGMMSGLSTPPAEAPPCLSTGTRSGRLFSDHRFYGHKFNRA